MKSYVTSLHWTTDIFWLKTLLYRQQLYVKSAIFQKRKNIILAANYRARNLTLVLKHFERNFKFYEYRNLGNYIFNFLKMKISFIGNEHHFVAHNFKKLILHRSVTNLSVSNYLYIIYSIKGQGILTSTHVSDPSLYSLCFKLPK